MAANMLSSIPEESSIREMDMNSSSIVTDMNHHGGLNSSDKMDRNLQSLVIPQIHGPEDDTAGDSPNKGNNKNAKINHRRFGKNVAKFLSSSHNGESQMKTLEQAPGNLDDVRVLTPVPMDIAPTDPSPDGSHKSQLINIQFGNNTNSAGSDHAAQKEGKLRLSNHHSKKSSRAHSRNETIEI